LDDLMLDVDASGDPRDAAELQAVLDAAIAFVQRVRPEFDYSRPLLGETVILSLYVTDDTGAFETPTTIALTVTLPDGTVSTETVGAPSSPGQYAHPFLTTTSGVYLVSWTMTGPGSTGTREHAEQLTVFPLKGTRKSPPSDLKLGAIRLAARWYSRRLTPNALIELGDLGGARVPSFDPDIERLLKIGKYRSSVIA
jgi:hypothetical protein